MDIRRLSYFTQVAELGSLNATAEEVNLSQPSLSRQIRLLEEELGVSLFSRRRNGMELTREGVELRMRITGPLRQLELALQDMRSLGSQTGGSVALGLPASVINVLASPLVRAAKEAAPNISLYIEEGYAGGLLSSLERGEIDLALLYGPPANWRCKTENLLVEELLLVGPPDSDLSPDVPVSSEQLAQLPLILPSPPNQPRGIRQIAESISEVSAMRTNFPVHADSLQLAKAYVGAGLGYTLLPYSAFFHEADLNLLKFAPVEDAKSMRHLVLGIHAAGQNPRATSTIKSLIYREIKRLESEGRWKAQLLFDSTPD